jgi:hypothetical protein
MTDTGLAGSSSSEPSATSTSKLPVWVAYELGHNRTHTGTVQTNNLVGTLNTLTSQYNTTDRFSEMCLRITMKVDSHAVTFGIYTQHRGTLLLTA